ncbi:acid protease [Favolaschia claudopus]|uniref:Acid protease n=1 Tax=Favolaschia claudopus TaxID=2862362 RepID=A0AAW0EHP8_9AGAR
MLFAFLFAFCYCLSVLAAVSGARITKRTVTPPQTLVIPVSRDENQVYSVMVNMSSNPSPQSFAFAISTSTAITTVAGSSCNSCGGVPSYNPSISSSVQQSTKSQNVSTMNGVASGTLVQENCGLIQRNGSAWLYPNQTVTVANQATSFFSPGVSGMIGMGLAPFEDSPAQNWLLHNPTQLAFSYGIALDPPSSSNSSGSGGELHWLQPDQSFHEGEVTWKSMLAANATNPSNMSSWYVEMDAWSATGSSGFNVTQSGTQLLTFLDPLYADIVFPQGAARSIYANIPGASKHSTSAFAHAWKLPCDSRFSVAVTFGSFSTSLDQSALVVKQADGVCVGILQEWIDQTSTEYLLGSPFIAGLYLIFSYAQNGQGTMGVAARSSKNNRLSPAVIAGVVLGTLAVLALIVIAAVLVYFAWLRRSPTSHKRKVSKSEITPFTDISDSSPSRDSRQRDHIGRRTWLAPNTPDSPDWATTLLSDRSSPNSNTFPGGTTYSESRSSQQYYNNADGNVNSTTSLIQLDTPPPYVNTTTPPPVPLLPLRKTRRLL